MWQFEFDIDVICLSITIDTDNCMELSYSSIDVLSRSVPFILALCQL